MNSQSILQEKINLTYLRVINAEHRFLMHRSYITRFVARSKPLIGIVATASLVGSWFISKKLTIDQKVKRLARYGVMTMVSSIKRRYLF